MPTTHRTAADQTTGGPERQLSCPTCATRVFHDDLACLRCGADLIYDLDRLVFALDLAPCPSRSTWRCNWAATPDGPCPACLLTEVTDRAADVEQVAVHRQAIRRTLRRLHDGHRIDPASLSPALRFVLDRSGDGHDVVIGHADGVVTLDVAEADTVELESRRQTLGEPYRTPLGHVRHESGHWLWEAVVARDPALLDRFRQVFGDERADYPEALADHYAGADDGSWRAGHVSYYASAHPWEDFAESVAHVLHIDDVTTTAAAAGLYRAAGTGFEDRYNSWAGLVVELNEITRAMGESDLYPFAPSPTAVDKMRLAEEVLVAAGTAPTGPLRPGPPVSIPPHPDRAGPTGARPGTRLGSR